jgi:hypothetical protein
LGGSMSSTGTAARVVVACTTAACSAPRCTAAPVSTSSRAAGLTWRGWGEDPPLRWGTEPGGVLVGGGVEVERPVAAAGDWGEVELHAGARLDPAEVGQVGRGGRALAAVGDAAGEVQPPVRVQQLPADGCAAVGEGDHIGRCVAAVGEVQQRPAACFGQPGSGLVECARLALRLGLMLALRIRWSARRGGRCGSATSGFAGAGRAGTRMCPARG